MDAELAKKIKKLSRIWGVKECLVYKTKFVRQIQVDLGAIIPSVTVTYDQGDSETLITDSEGEEFLFENTK